jgi:putative ATP-dependent endonuclease of OLD family
VHLTKLAVRGFRSLTDVSNIPISGPTILAGHNDGGKTAILASLAFLLGKHKLTEEDRTYLQAASGQQAEEQLLRHLERRSRGHGGRRSSRGRRPLA